MGIIGLKPCCICVMLPGAVMLLTSQEDGSREDAADAGCSAAPESACVLGG